MSFDKKPTPSAKYETHTWQKVELIDAALRDKNEAMWLNQV